MLYLSKKLLWVEFCQGCHVDEVCELLISHLPHLLTAAPYQDLNDEVLHTHHTIPPICWVQK